MSKKAKRVDWIPNAADNLTPDIITGSSIRVKYAKQYHKDNIEGFDNETRKVTK